MLFTRKRQATLRCYRSLAGAFARFASRAASARCEHEVTEVEQLALRC